MSFKYDKNNTNFPLEIYNFLQQSQKSQQTELSFLKDYQSTTVSYATDFLEHTNINGLLIYHGMGLGKTITAITLAFRQLEKKLYKKIIFVLSKSLMENLIKNIHDYINMRLKYEDDFVLPGTQKILSQPKYAKDMNTTEIRNWIEGTFIFVSLNASNMIKQLYRNIRQRELKFVYGTEEKYSLHNVSIIVDEAHNLFNSIINGSKNGKEFYELIRSSAKENHNYFLGLLTGTPIINDTFEISACFNLLYNGIIPDIYWDFKSLFIDEQNRKIINKEILQNRLFGLISYVSNRGLEKLIPEKLPTKIHFVPMDAEQYGKYSAIRSIEMREGESSSGSNNDNISSLQKPRSGKTTSYRNKSRQYSNYVPPSSYTKQIQSRRKISPQEKQEIFDKIPQEEIYSPKFAEILNNIENNNRNKGLVYSQFSGPGGLLAFKKYLQNQGWQEIKIDKQGATNVQDSGKNFTLITGDVDFEVRKQIESIFNDIQNNPRGERLALLLVSSAAAEGLDFTGGRQIHIMDPYWNYSRIMQIMYRIIRIGSHEYLPSDERNVSVHIYVSIEKDRNYFIKSWNTEELVSGEEINTDEESKKNSTAELLNTLEYLGGDKGTTEVKLLLDSVNDYIFITSILEILQNTSIECKYFGRESCYVCTPDNKLLYSSDIYKDTRRENPCVPYNEEKVRVSKIKVPSSSGTEIEYYYNFNDENIYGYNVYKYDPEVDAYVSLPEDEEFLEVLDQIKKNN